MAWEVGALGPLCRGAAPIARAGLGDARRASPKSGRQVWACWVWARRAQTQQAQSLDRHVVTIPVGFGPRHPDKCHPDLCYLVLCFTRTCVLPGLVLPGPKKPSRTPPGLVLPGTLCLHLFSIWQVFPSHNIFLLLDVFLPIL